MTTNNDIDAIKKRNAQSQGTQNKPADNTNLFFSLRISNDIRQHN